MELVDNYCSNYLFGSLTNYDINENYAVLTLMEVYSFIKQEFRKALNEFLLSFNTESVVNATWRKPLCNEILENEKRVIRRHE